MMHSITDLQRFRLQLLSLQVAELANGSRVTGLSLSVAPAAPRPAATQA